MRLPLLALVICFALPGITHASNPAQSYNDGNARYKAGDYEGALALYGAITTVNPSLEYNRGAAHLKAGRLGKAALHFRRVLKLAPGDADAQASLDYINSIKPDREKPQKPGMADQLLADLRGQFSVDAITFATLVLYYLAGVSGAIWFLAKTTGLRRRAAIVCAAFTALTIFSGTILAVMAAEIGSHDMAVAVEKTVDALSEPSEKSDTLFTFHEATACRLGRREGKYVFVTLASGISGWVDAGKLDII